MCVCATKHIREYTLKKKWHIETLFFTNHVFFVEVKSMFDSSLLLLLFSSTERERKEKTNGMQRNSRVLV